MKTVSILIALGVLAGAGTFSMAAERLEFSELPAAVQNTVNAQVGSAGISSIQRVTRHGIPMYEVRMTEQGNRRPIYISETGSVINLDHIVTAGAPKEGSRKGTFRDLPVPVQNSVRGQAGAARVEDIDIITRHGETTYNVAFKQDGKNVELLLDANGNVLNQGQPAATSESMTRAPLSAASKVKPDELPRRVRSTLEKYTQGANIEDVDKGTLQGRTVYEAAFKRSGQHVELRVAEDGTLIRDDINNKFLSDIGQPPAGTVSQQAQSANRPSWAQASARRPLADAGKVSYRELPGAVRETLRTYAGDARIEDIDKGKLGDSTVYQAAFKHNNQNVELRISEDGSLVRDAVNERILTQLRRPAQTEAAGRAPSWQVLTGGEASNNLQLTDLKAVRFNELPAAVQTALRNQAGTSAIEAVRQGTLKDKTVYEAFYSRGDQTRVVRVAADGTVLK